MTPEPSVRRWQFSLGMLFVVTALVAVGCSIWLTIRSVEIPGDILLPALYVGGITAAILMGILAAR